MGKAICEICGAEIEYVAGRAPKACKGDCRKKLQQLYARKYRDAHKSELRSKAKQYYKPKRAVRKVQTKNENQTWLDNYSKADRLTKMSLLAAECHYLGYTISTYGQLVNLEEWIIKGIEKKAIARRERLANEQ